MIEKAIAAITEQQPKVQNAVFMVGEQLKDIIRNEPHLAEIVAQDFENAEMKLESCEKEIKKYADANRSGNCSCVTPQAAEKIIRSFYGLPERGVERVPQVRPAAKPAGVCINLEDFM